MRVTVCQLDPGEAGAPGYLTDLGEHGRANRTDLVLLPEMPFSSWLAADPKPDGAKWVDAVEAHETQLATLDALGVEHVVATRPIINAEGSRRNQAFVWSATSGEARGVRDKHYLPDEEGYWEASWYDRGTRSFDTTTVGEAIAGIQICTEMWFLEWARQYAELGADLLCVPRATPRASTDKWLAGGRTAAVCSGAYCLSSNLWHDPGVSAADCGGLGWVIDPEGDVLATTSRDEPFATVDIDLEFSGRSKSTYPRCVAT